MHENQPSSASEGSGDAPLSLGLAVADTVDADLVAAGAVAATAAEGSKPRLVAAGEGHAAERPAALADRFASQGLFLFRYRSLFTVILLPAAALAIYQQRALEVGPDPGVGWLLSGLGLCLAGLTVRILTLGFVPNGTSGRDTEQPLAAVLNTSGMYSVTRHPIYFANVLMLLGYTVALRVWWFPLLAVAVYWLLFERIMAAEERYLARRFGAEYTRWSQRTPVFWPRFSSWRSPDLPFCWRAILRREYNSVNLIATMLLFARFANQVLVGGMTFTEWVRDDAWLLWAYGGVAVGFVVLRTLRRNTTLLNSPAR